LQEAAYRRIVDGGLSGDDALALARSLRQTARASIRPAPAPPASDEVPTSNPDAATTAAPADRLPTLGRELRAVVGAIRAETDRPHSAAVRAALLIDLDWAQRTIEAIRTRLAP
jgi:hypothetical protein